MYFSLYSNEANYFSINDEKDVQKLWDQPPRNDSNDKKKEKKFYWRKWIFIRFSK